MVTAARFRKLALALPDASSAPHFDRTGFRTPRRIFATLAADGRSATLMLDRALQAAAVETRPHAFAALPNKWGDKGATSVDLAAVDEADLVAILKEAHAMSTLKAPPKRRPAR